MYHHNILHLYHSVALLLQNGIGRFMYASTFDYTKIALGPTYDSAYSDPIQLPMLSTQAMDMLSVGSEYTRVQKTMAVADLEESHRSLDVCVRGAGNCSTCWKCMRTLLTLEIGGVLDRYSDSFDLDAYQKRRSAYIGSMLRSRDPLLREIVQFARKRGYRIPIKSRVSALLRHPAKWCRRVVQLPRKAGRRLNVFCRTARSEK